MGHLLAKIGLGRLLHLHQHHCRDLFWSEGLRVGSDLDLNVWPVVLVRDFERVIFDVLLDRGLVKAASDQTLDVEHRVLRIGRKLVLGSIADQTFTFWCESNIGWRDAITLVIGYDLYTTVLENSNTEITQSIVILTDTSGGLHNKPCHTPQLSPRPSSWICAW